MALLAWLLQLGSIISPFVTYGIAGVSAVFFWIANHLISDYNRESKEIWARIDARWRFYSLFTCLMLVSFVQCMGLPLHLLASLWSSGWALLAFANGLLPFPVLWLELVYSESSRALGFTKYYEDNAKDIFPSQLQLYHDAQQNDRRSARRSPGDWVRFKIRFVWTWFLVYVLVSATTHHLRSNRRNPNLRDGWTRTLQTLQDLLVIGTVWLYLLSCVLSALALVRWLSSIIPVLHGLAGSEALRQPFLLLSLWAPYMLLTLVGSIGLAFVAQVTPGALHKRGLLGLLLLYMLALGSDLAAAGALKGLAGAGKRLADALPAGGLTPWALAALLLYLVRIFFEQFREAQKIAQQSAALGEFALHKFGNLLSPPSATLRLLRKEVASDAALARLRESPARLREVVRQIDLAVDTLDNARRILADLKARSREVWQDRWFRLAPALQSLGSVSPDIPVRIDGGPAELDLYADQEALLDTLRNLVENGRHAIATKGRPGGEVRVRATWDEQRVFYPLLISVRDNGTGIDDRVRRRMYNAGVTTKSDGSGLGLFVVREFVNRIGGLIDERTETGPDSFTEFRILFPRERVRNVPASGG